MSIIWSLQNLARWVSIRQLIRDNYKGNWNLRRAAAEIGALSAAIISQSLPWCAAAYLV